MKGYKQMEDVGNVGEALRQLIQEAVEKCIDLELLDLIYKLLLS